MKQINLIRWKVETWELDKVDLVFLMLEVLEMEMKLNDYKL